MKRQGALHPSSRNSTIQSVILSVWNETRRCMEDQHSLVFIISKVCIFQASSVLLDTVIVCSTADMRKGEFYERKLFFKKKLPNVVENYFWVHLNQFIEQWFQQKQRNISMLKKVLNYFCFVFWMPSTFVHYLEMQCKTLQQIMHSLNGSDNTDKYKTRTQSEHTKLNDLSHMVFP